MSGASNLQERIYLLPFFKLAGMLIIFVSLTVVIVGCVLICAVADGIKVKKSAISFINLFLLFFSIVSLKNLSDFWCPKNSLCEFFRILFNASFSFSKPLNTELSLLAV